MLTCPQLGILTLTLTNPIWVTKTRLVLQYNADPTGKQYKGMIDALVKIYRHEGLPGLYKVRRQCNFVLSCNIATHELHILPNDRQAVWSRNFRATLCCYNNKSCPLSY